MDISIRKEKKEINKKQKKESMLILVTFRLHMVKLLKNKGENILRCKNKSCKIYSIDSKLRKPKKSKIFEIRLRRIVIIKIYLYS